MPPFPLGGADEASCPPDDSRLSALVRKFGCVDLGVTGVYGAVPSPAFCPCGSTALRDAICTGGRGSSSSSVLDSGATGERGVCSPFAAAAAAGWALEGEDENLDEMLESHELRRITVGPGRVDLPGTLAGEPTLSVVGIVRVGGPARWGIWRGVDGGVSRGAEAAAVVPFVFGTGDDRPAVSDVRELDRSDRVERVLSGD